MSEKYKKHYERYRAHIKQIVNVNSDYKARLFLLAELNLNLFQIVILLREINKTLGVGT